MRYIITPENFVYWLQGWFELNDTVDHREGATPETLQVIRDHLDLVFDKKTPDRSIEEEINKRVFQPITMPYKWEGYSRTPTPICEHMDCSSVWTDTDPMVQPSC